MSKNGNIMVRTIKIRENVRSVIFRKGGTKTTGLLPSRLTRSINSSLTIVSKNLPVSGDNS